MTSEIATFTYQFCGLSLICKIETDNNGWSASAQDKTGQWVVLTDKPDQVRGIALLLGLEIH